MTEQEANIIDSKLDELNEMLKDNAPSITSEINDFLMKRAGMLSDTDSMLLREGIKQGILIAHERFLEHCFLPLVKIFEKNAETLAAENDEKTEIMNSGAVATIGICGKFSHSEVERLKTEK